MTEKARYLKARAALASANEIAAAMAFQAGAANVVAQVEGCYSITAPQMFRILRVAVEEESAKIAERVAK